MTQPEMGFVPVAAVIAAPPPARRAKGYKGPAIHVRRQGNGELPPHRPSETNNGRGADADGVPGGLPTSCGPGLPDAPSQGRKTMNPTTPVSHDLFECRHKAHL